MALLFGEKFSDIVAILVFVDNDVLGRRDEAVLDAAIAAKAFLVGSGMEKTDVERVVLLEFGEEDGVGVGIGIVVVLTVAGQAAKEHTLVLAVPVVDGEHDEALVDAPGIGKGGNERAVDHIPHLTVVLLLLFQNAVKGGTALTDSETAKLGEDIGFGHFPIGADILDLSQHLLGHILIVVGGGKGSLAGETAPDVQRIEFGADTFQIAINIDALGELIPIVGGVADAGVDEEMEHFEGELLVRFHLLLVETDDVAVAHAETGGVEIELGLFLGGDADAQLHGDFGIPEALVETVILVLVVEHWDYIVETIGIKIDNVFDILLAFVAIADDEDVLVEQFLFVELLYQVDVESRRSFEIDVVFQRLLEYKTEVTGFGTIAIIVGAGIIGFCDSDVEHAFGPLDLRGDFRQICNLQRRTVLLDNLHQRNVVEIEFALLGAKFILWKIESLID